MARAWVVDGKGFAGKVKNATVLPENQIKDCGASRECPNCYRCIDNSDISAEWPGLPAGVKFDPSDVELVQHLAGKLGFGGTKPHPFINEFIPTLEGEQGICYAHPDNLPGARRDGTSVHFFHQTSKAYATGQRKRRKISDESSSTEDNGRWHKTGKTKSIMEIGGLKGYKKIMVLYKSSKKGSKAEKTPWVVHQYHLGTKEDEAEGEFVVSKIFYQQQPKFIAEKKDLEESTVLNRPPTTPNTFPPNPPRRGKRAFVDEIEEEASFLDQIDENYIYNSVFKTLPAQIEEPKLEENQPGGASIEFQDPHAEHAWLAGESQALDLGDDLDSFLYCNEMFDPSGFNLEMNTMGNLKGETSGANADDGFTDYSLFFNSQELMDNLHWMN